MSGLYDPYDAKTNQMRNATPEEREAYERMLLRMSMPLTQEQECMQKINRLMLNVGRLKEQNEQLRELVERMWLIRHNDPMSFEWARVMEEAERLGITLEHTK